MAYHEERIRTRRTTKRTKARPEHILYIMFAPSQIPCTYIYIYIYIRTSLRRHPDGSAAFVAETVQCRACSLGVPRLEIVHEANAVALAFFVSKKLHACVVERPERREHSKQSFWCGLLLRNEKVYIYTHLCIYVYIYIHI